MYWSDIYKTEFVFLVNFFLQLFKYDKVYICNVLNEKKILLACFQYMVKKL